MTKKLIDIDGRAVFVVYCWTRNDVTIVGVASSDKEAERMRKAYIAAAPDAEGERFSCARKNNTMVHGCFVNTVGDGS